MVATMPTQPYITEMIPAGFSADGSMTYRMTGLFAEVFDNLQVSEATINNLPFEMTNDH